MKKIYHLLILFTLLVNGCSQNEVVNEQSPSSNPLIYTASFEKSESRTYLNEDGYLRWTADDQISIFGANTYNQQYKFTGKTGANSGTFEKVTGSYTTGTDLNHHYALYPYSSQTTISETGVITATIPANQTYAVNSFGLGDNTMVAVTADKDDTFLKFKNVGGYLELKLYGDNITVKSIKLEGNSDEKLAGNATITSIYGQDPTINMANDATKTITMDCGDSGIQLGSTTETATTFLLVVPPTTFTSGFTITVTDINGGEFTKSTSKSIEIKRNIIQPMNAFKIEFEETPTEKTALLLPDGYTFNTTVSNYLTNNSTLTKIKFVVDSKTISENMLVTDKNGSIAYLVSNGEWLEIHTSATGYKTHAECYSMFSGETENSPFREILAIDFGDYFDTSETLYMNQMFYNCIKLTTLDVSKFNTSKATHLDSMFSGCSSLSALNVENFNTSNVTDMAGLFSGCSNLSSIDVSNFNTSIATKMQAMFKGCSKLTTIDITNFVTTNVNDMRNMFNNCSCITLLDLSNFTFSSNPKVDYMFYQLDSNNITIKVTQEGYEYLTATSSDVQISSNAFKIIE